MNSPHGSFYLFKRNLMCFPHFKTDFQGLDIWVLNFTIKSYQNQIKMVLSKTRYQLNVETVV